MASSIAAITTGIGGVVTTADNSGDLNLQSGTTTIVSITSAGAAVTGTLSASGATTFPAGSAAAPAITTTGDTNTGMFFPAADTIAFAEGGVESMRIDSAGNLGLGIPPSAWMTANSVKALQFNAGAIWSYSTYEMQLLQNCYYNSSGAYIYSTTAAATFYQQQLGKHAWFTAPSGTAGTTATFTQVLAVEKDKSLALQGATSQTGAGITFPATQSASTNANTLDDYEEGTWTPIIVGASTAGTGTYTIQVGTYTKVGRLVTVTCTIVWTAHTGTGIMQISSIPFTVANINANVEYTAVPEFFNMTMPASTTPFVITANNATVLTLYSQAVGTGALTGLQMDSFANIYMSMTYQTA